MRTLEEFQKEVLAPLRKERDEKHEVALKIKTDGGEAFAKRKKELLDKEVEFKERQKSSLKEFIGKQTLEKKSFFVQQDADRAEAHAQYQKATQDYKIAKIPVFQQTCDPAASCHAIQKKHFFSGKPGFQLFLMSVYQMSQHKKRKSGKQIVSKLHNTEMLFREQEGRKFLHSEMDQKQRLPYF